MESIRELTAMQEAFCRAYVNDPKRNGTRAAIAAGYSETGAAIEAFRLLRNANISRRIKDLECEALEEAGYSIESLRPFILRRHCAIATTDITDIVQVVYENDRRRRAALEQIADGNNGQYPLDFGDALIYVKPTSEWSPDERMAVKSIKYGKNGNIEVEKYDSLVAMKQLAEIVGLKDSDVSVNLNIADELSAARKRVES